MNFGQTLLLFTTVMLATMPAVLSCDCMPREPKEIVCSADYVVKVTAETYEPADDPFMNPSIYTMIVDQIYKSNAAFDSVIAENKIAVDNMAPTSCEMYFQLGQSYLIIGSYSGSGLVTIGACNDVFRWNSLTEDQLYTFTEKYINNGNCKDC